MDTYTSDKKMLLLIDILKSLGKIRFDNDFCKAIGLLKSNLNKIKKGEKHFTPKHIENAINGYKVDGNWIFGVSDSIFLNTRKSTLLPKNINTIKNITN